MKNFLKILSICLGLLSFAAAAEAQVCAVLYEHADYTGATYQAYEGNNSYIGNWWNDKVSAVRVMDGCHITMYEHADYQGLLFIRYTDSAYVGNIFNDLTSSYKCECF